MNPKTLSLYQTYLSRTIALLCGICALSVFLYGTFLLLAVEHTAARTTLGKHVTALTLEMSTLETEYLAKSKALTLGQATALGFEKSASVTAVFAEARSGGLSLQH